jgi:5-methyltetrahydropteroyltriglutamate--homocysteine methyltransferase
VPYLIKTCMGENTLKIATDCGLGGRVDQQIAWAKLRALRDGAALATKTLWC